MVSLGKYFQSCWDSDGQKVCYLAKRAGFDIFKIFSLFNDYGGLDL